MAKSKDVVLDYAFFKTLWGFYLANKGQIRRYYKELTKKFLDFNDPVNIKSFLRKPQFEALEMYIFLKEFAENSPVHEIFTDWYKKQGRYENLSHSKYNDKMEKSELTLFETLPEEEYKKVFAVIKDNAESYSNYIFALTMGTGKTILMATCIFYEFLLANKFPKGKKYCHNALVFAPDKTVLQSLKEIMTFNKSKVVPTEYINFLDANINFHFLDDSTTLNTIDKSKYNVIITNTQKIILKKQHKKSTAGDQLFKQLKIDTGSVIDDLTKDIWSFDEIITEDSDIQLNQRFQKLLRLEQIGIYVDEAHHLFGKDLEKDLLKSTSKTSLRTTINELANNLERAGTHVVACYNFTGTPYVKNKILPEVVYAYGLKEAISNKYLKEVKINGYEGNIKSYEFVREMVREFWDSYGGKTYENLNPKLAIFSPTIEDLTDNLKPILERVLIELNISTSKILVNVGDDKVTTNDDIRNFNNLDKPGTEGNEKQFILLVNKGQEGWNCRSLFAVGLYREPKSRIFVLQATMRCLRQIGDFQETGRVFLSEENYKILDDELQSNFNISIKDIQKSGKEKETYEVRLIPPIKTIKLKRVRHKYEIKKINNESSIDFKLNSIDTEKYKITKIERDSLNKAAVTITKDISNIKEKRSYSKLTLIAEVSRYLNYPCIKIDKILKNSVEGTEEILKFVNNFNEILYDEIIPKIFNHLFEIDKKTETIEEEIELIKDPKEKLNEDFYGFKSEDGLVVKIGEIEERLRNKTFHVDTYCFDSVPEKGMFWYLLKEKKIKEFYFMGMFTHGQTDFYIQYIDPDSKTVRSYYPDFLAQREDGVWEIIEVKGDNMIDDVVVKAKKEFAEEMAAENNMTYTIVPSTKIMNGSYQI